jgi:site-specific recombinase XerD
MLAPLAAESLRLALETAARAVEQADAANTRRAIASDLRHAGRWFAAHGISWPDDPARPLAVAELAAYLGGMVAAGLAAATIRRRATTLARWHRERCFASPVGDPAIGRLLAGVSRTAAASSKKAAASPAMISAALRSDGFSIREKALLAVGFVTGLRRSELTGLAWSDLEEDQASGSFVLVLRQTKTGSDQRSAVPATGHAETCPATWLRRWRAESGGVGFVFACSERTIARLVQRAAALSGHDPAAYGAHSLRSGLATVAARGGVSLGEIMAATRHRSAQVAAGYLRAREQLANEAHRCAAEALR